MLLQRLKPLWKEAVKDLSGQTAVINSIKIFLKNKPDTNGHQSKAIIDAQ
jgi:hypothetical protein